MTKEKLLAALDKPRSTDEALMIANFGRSVVAAQAMLMEMRDEGLVKFDIYKGQWSRALPFAN